MELSDFIGFENRIKKLFKQYECRYLNSIGFNILRMLNKVIYIIETLIILKNTKNDSNESSQISII